MTTASVDDLERELAEFGFLRGCREAMRRYRRRR